jgi:predicted nuclease of predicted toxin-antitoxin system
VANVVLDEDLQRSLADHLRNAGHLVERVVEVGLKSAPDETIFRYAQQKQAVVITGDLGFVNAATLPSDHCGVILLRFPNEMATDSIDLEVMRFLSDQVSLDDMRGRFVVLEPGGGARFRERRE